jgi:hypothetical protein
MTRAYEIIEHEHELIKSCFIWQKSARTSGTSGCPITRSPVPASVQSRNGRAAGKDCTTGTD